MAITYETIATATISSSATVNFTSISAGYTDLKLYLNNIKPSAASSLYMRFNGDTAANYCYALFGTQGATKTATYSGGTGLINLVGDIVNFPTAVYSNIEIDIMSYSNSNYYKPFFAQVNVPYSTSSYIASEMGKWKNLSVVSSVLVGVNTGNFSGTATLVGIKKA